MNQPVFLKHICILLVAMIGFTSYAQSDYRNRLGDVYYDPYMYKQKYNDPDGSPYLNETFTQAKINDISETQLVRFNAYEGTVEVKLSANRVVVLKESEDYVISLNDGSGRIYETHGFRDSKGNLKNSFFEMVHRGEKYTLYLKENVKFFKAEKAEGYKAAKPASFKKLNDVFYITDLWDRTPVLVELPVRTKNFTGLFPDQAQEVKKLIKSEKLQLDNKEDLVKLLDFCLTRS